MASFFDKFTSFTPNPSLTASQNFARLSTIQKWSPSNIKYQHTIFLTVFLAENPSSPIHTFFISSYLNTLPDYDPCASPHTEFDRLRASLGFAPKSKSKTYKQIKQQFLEAFREEFHSKLDEFFFDFYVTANFLYNPRNGAVGELQRLKNHQHWSRRKWKTIQARFRRAFEAEFVSVFGANDNYRAGWEALCELLDVDPVPPSVTQCKKVLSKIHVNIYDVLELWRGQRQGITRFRNVAQLSRYSQEEDKIYPKKKAKAGVMKFLLRPLFSC